MTRLMSLLIISKFRMTLPASKDARRGKQPKEAIAKEPGGARIGIERARKNKAAQDKKDNDDSAETVKEGGEYPKSETVKPIFYSCGGRTVQKPA